MRPYQLGLGSAVLRWRSLPRHTSAGLLQADVDEVGLTIIQRDADAPEAGGGGPLGAPVVLVLCVSPVVGSARPGDVAERDERDCMRLQLAHRRM